MGLKKFSETYDYVRTVQIIDMAGERIAIDAFWKLYQALLGMEKVNQLTDRNGNTTAHIQVALSQILQMHRAGIKQIWVFDYVEEGPKTDNKHHNPAKQAEIDKRRQNKDVNRMKIQALTLEAFNKPKTIDFGDLTETQEQEEKKHQTEINKLEKRSFTVTNDQVNDLKKILDLLNIPYVNGIEGYEGEQIASYLVQQDLADAVFSGDSDPLAFGAKKLYRSVKQHIYEYTLEDIFRQIKENSGTTEPTIDNFRKIAAIMGTDYCPKTPNVGPKTVFAKYFTINLTKEQKEAFAEFSKLDNEKINVEIINSNATPFESTKKQQLIDWLVAEKGFNRELLQKRLANADVPLKSKKTNLFTAEETKTAKPRKTKTKDETKVEQKPKRKTKTLKIVLDETEEHPVSKVSPKAILTENIPKLITKPRIRKVV